MIHRKVPMFLDIWQTRIEVMKDNEFKTIESILMFRTVINLVLSINISRSIPFYGW
eukprot:jgi/Orpsp1_1/1180684/evm.model.c7180000074315.1